MTSLISIGKVFGVFLRSQSFAALYREGLFKSSD